MIRPQTSARRRRAVFLFALDPVLDGAAAARAVEAFRKVREREPILWLDLSAVGSASTAGLETLGRFADAAQSASVTVRLIGVTAVVRSALDGTPLERYVWHPPPAA
jgi:anti-anti-sigma regulatory factor